VAEQRSPADAEAPLIAGMARFRAGQPAAAIAPFRRAVRRRSPSS
jgi:Flp pilus assembly protein TadD